MRSPQVTLAPAQLLPPSVLDISHEEYSLECPSRAEFGQTLSAEIERLRQRSSHDQISSRLDWLASIRPIAGWQERVLLLRRNHDLQAAIFLREKTLAGMPTGYFQGSSVRGDTLVLSEPGCEAGYLALATRWLFKNHRGFLLVLHQPAEDALKLDLSPRLHQRHTASQLHWQTPLQPNLDATIASFSHRTRRNIRFSLRYVESAGWHFHPDLTCSQTQLALRDLAGRCTHPFSREQAEERLEIIANTPGAFAMGLTDAQGRWLCCLIGRRTPQATEIFWQLNATGLRKVSLCITMRALMMREEIRRGAPRLDYIGGSCALSLASESRYAAIARPGLRLWLARIFARRGSVFGPILRDLL